MGTRVRDRLGSRTAWARFRRNRAARASAVALVVLTGVCLATLPLSVKWYNVQELSQAVRHAPSAGPVVPAASFGAGPDDATRSPWRRAAHRSVSWLGHDDLGRSLLYRLMPGFLISLAVGLAAALMAVVLGTMWGATAALAGGRIDLLMMRVVDVLYGLPYILSVILLKIALTRPLATLLGGHTRTAELIILILAIGGVSWLTMARVIRGQVLFLRASLYIEAARAAGGGSLYILRRHLLPNLIGPIVVYATLVVPQAILQESFLSFLGVGVQPPQATWGSLAADGVRLLNPVRFDWWLVVFPCAALSVTLLALNFVGDGLRDALDVRGKPMSRQRLDASRTSRPQC